jgi:hypothetical protein
MDKSTSNRVHRLTEDREWLYESCHNPLVSWECQDGRVSSCPPFADMPVRHAKLFPMALGHFQDN